MVLTVLWYDVTLQPSWCHYFKGHWDTQPVFIFHFLLGTLRLKSWLTSPSCWGFGRPLRSQKFQKELKTDSEVWNIKGWSKIKLSFKKDKLIWHRLNDLFNKNYTKYKGEDSNKVDIIPNLKLFSNSHHCPLITREGKHISSNTF